MSTQKRTSENLSSTRQQKIVRRDYLNVVAHQIGRSDSFTDYYDGLEHSIRTDDDGFTLEYMRGLFDSDNGCVVSEDEVRIFFNDRELMHSFIRNVGVACSIDGDNVVFRGFNVIDFLGKIYPPELIICNDTKYQWFKSLISFNDIGPGLFKVARTLEGAVMPSKPNRSDMGFDLTIIKYLKTVGDVEFYDTGIAVQPSLGYYCLVYPRSSISKTGYMLANSVGVIDSTYTGNLVIALRKVDKDACDIVLPCRIAQLVPQRVFYPDMVQVDSLDDTNRGVGGFGSSNKA